MLFQRSSVAWNASEPWDVTVAAEFAAFRLSFGVFGFAVDADVEIDADADADAAVTFSCCATATASPLGLPKNARLLRSFSGSSVASSAIFCLTVKVAYSFLAATTILDISLP